MFNSQPGFRPQPMQGQQQAQQFNSQRGQQMQGMQYQNSNNNPSQQMQKPIQQQPPSQQPTSQQPPLQQQNALPYVPQSDAERIYYDQLFDIADAQHAGQVSGQQAVQFLMLSGVQLPVLKVSDLPVHIFKLG